MWLNEGFASYSEWLWSEHEGEGTAQEIYDSYRVIPADDEFWSNPTADPGVADLFGPAVYDRGALALHTLRLEVGDATFFRILKTWAAKHKYGNVSTGEFTALAEKLSGRDLDALFDAWLYTGAKPPGFEPAPETLSKCAKSTLRIDLKKRFGDGKAAG